MRRFQSSRVAKPQECERLRVRSLTPHFGHAQRGRVVEFEERLLIAGTQKGPGDPSPFPGETKVPPPSLALAGLKAPPLLFV